MKLTIKKCTIDDLSTLRELSYNTYYDTFKDMNTPENMEAYLTKAFEIDKLRNELLNSDSSFYFLYADGNLTGYLKLNDYLAQSDVHDPESLEIERIYVAKEFHDKGLGSALMEKALETAHLLNKSYIWLGVWEKNDKALQFYKKNGFYIIGKHSFFMGDDEQTDFIMRKDL